MVGNAISKFANRLRSLKQSTYFYQVGLFGVIKRGSKSFFEFS
jgi:hypothetical protein